MTPAKPRLMIKEENFNEAVMLLGWAQSYLTRGKISEAQNLITKALISLGKEPWYED